MSINLCLFASALSRWAALSRMSEARIAKELRELTQLAPHEHVHGPILMVGCLICDLK